VVDVVDPALVNEDSIIDKKLISILKVGVACSAELPRERLEVSDAMAG
jgi:hypothetical protein